MKTNKRVEMIIDYAEKVMQFPRGSAGYDPVDELNLRDAIDKYQKEQSRVNKPSIQASAIPDFKKYFDSTYKRNYWVLGYFGGGSVNIEKAYDLAMQFSDAIKVPLDSVRIDEILSSRRYKGYKFMYSVIAYQKPQKGAEEIKDFHAYMCD